MRALWVSLIGLALIAVVAGGVIGATRLTRVDQPIAFNHSAHVEDVGMVCLDCHVHAEELARATIPNLEVCEECHAEPLGDTPALLAVTRSVEAGEPIPWRKVYRVPDHVYFSHRRHTALGKIACETCHGDIGARTQPVSRPLRRITMERCIDCHDAQGASNDCVVCHR